MLSGKTMTNDEARQILNIPSDEEDVDPQHVMKRFNTLIEKNQVEKGGSFYLQSKVYWAKQQLMVDYPEMNQSVWNPQGEGRIEREETEDEKK